MELKYYTDTHIAKAIAIQLRQAGWRLFVLKKWAWLKPMMNRI